MNRIRASSSSQLAPPPKTSEQQYDDSALEGVAAHIKLLLKLIQDHKDACNKEKNDSRRMLRVATMMTILDTVRNRIRKCQSFGQKRSEAQLATAAEDEQERLKRELSASLAARKSLEMMCSSLGKEKEIMATELSRKAQELNGMEELINDLKTRNEALLERIRGCALEHMERILEDGVGLGGESQRIIILQKQNDVLSEQLLRSLEGYRLMKKKLKEVKQEKTMMCNTMDEMRAKVKASLERVWSFKERASLSMSLGSNGVVHIGEEIEGLENMFECFQMLIAKHDQKQGECVEVKRGVNSCKPSVLA